LFVSGAGILTGGLCGGSVPPGALTLRGVCVCHEYDYIDVVVLNQEATESFFGGDC